MMPAVWRSRALSQARRDDFGIRHTTPRRA
jgi:hypothetical protein